MTDFRDPTAADLDLLAAIAVERVHNDGRGHAYLDTADWTDDPKDWPDPIDVTDQVTELHDRSGWISLPCEDDGTAIAGAYYELTVFGEQTLDHHRPGAIHAGSVDDANRYPGRYDGVPGLVWYAKSTQTLGADLKLGDWLDSLDHRGARSIAGVWVGDGTADLWELTRDDLDSNLRTVMFFGGDTETVRVDVLYDVVDPDSQVAPDGSPL